MLTESDSPCLIDMGARMHGSVGPTLWAECTSTEESQPFLVADVFLRDGAAVSLKIEEVRRGRDAYTLRKVGKHLDLQNHQAGILARSIEHTAGMFFRSLPSLWSMKFFVEEGDRLEPTRDVSTSPGYLILIGPNSEAVEHDARVVRKAETEGRVCIFEGAGRRARTVTECEEEGCVPSERPIPLNAESKLRELDLQATQMLSRVCSPAESPSISPLPGPVKLEDMEDLTLTEWAFTLDESVGETVDRLPPMEEFSLGGFSSDDGF